MADVVEFKVKPKEIYVHTCANCDGQVFYLEVCPDKIVRPRCYDCSCLSSHRLVSQDEDD